MALSTQVRWGVIGAGGIADRRTIPGLLAAQNCRLEAVMDLVNIEAVAGKYGVSKHTQTIEDILTDPSIDAVYIATPVYCHLAQIRQAAQAGKHILCEKPLTLTAGEARQAVEACRKSGVLLQEGYMMKFHGAHRRIRQLLHSGQLGKITYMRAQLSCWYPPIPNAWRQDPAKGGGGALIDMASHLYDLLEFFNGPVTGIFARTACQIHDYKSEDASLTVLDFANGALASIDCFFNIPDEASRTRLEIYGSRGAVFTEGTIGQGSDGAAEGLFKRTDTGYDAMQAKDAPPTFAPLDYEKINPYTAECSYFADCIINHKPVEINDDQHAIHIMELLDKAYESARTGRRLAV